MVRGGGRRRFVGLRKRTGKADGTYMGSLCTKFVWPLMCIGVARRTSGRAITSHNSTMCLEVESISIDHRDIARVQSRRDATSLTVFAIDHTLFVPRFGV